VLVHSQTRFLLPDEVHMWPGLPRSPNSLIPPRVNQSDSARLGGPENPMDIPVQYVRMCYTRRHLDNALSSTSIDFWVLTTYVQI
jgi:hypothetical protein